MKKLLSLLDIKMWKFLSVGILNFTVDHIIAFLLINLTDLNMWWCTAIPCAVASVQSYFLNKHFTFKNKEKGWKPAARFATTIACCWVVANLIAVPAVQWLLRDVQEAWRDNLTKVVETCLFSTCNYLGQRLFTFRKRK